MFSVSGVQRAKDIFHKASWADTFNKIHVFHFGFEPLRDVTHCIY